MATIPRTPRRSPRVLAWAAVLASLAAPGCAPEDGVDEARLLDCADQAGCAQHDAARDADDPRAFCDDHDPCTADANCTPCSALPPDERDIYHCTEDEDLPVFCAGRTGCVHVPMTTPAGQINSCFPVADAADGHSGVCRAGRCVDNDE